MPVPLIWLGAGLTGVMMARSAVRKQGNDLTRVAVYPGEAQQQVKPVNGAVVCCGIFGAFEHSGIWLDDHIVELKGNGLVRAVSPQRFISSRSGRQIFVCCDKQGIPLSLDGIAERTQQQIFTYQAYHLVKNNCHKFCASMIAGKPVTVTTFYDLNQFLNCFYHTMLAWYPIAQR